VTHGVWGVVGGHAVTVDGELINGHVYIGMYICVCMRLATCSDHGRDRRPACVLRKNVTWQDSGQVPRCYHKGASRTSLMISMRNARQSCISDAKMCILLITTLETTCDARICDAGVLCCQKRQMDCAGPQPNDVMRTPKTTDDMPGGYLITEHAEKKRKYCYTTCDDAPPVCLLPGLPGPHWPGAVAMRSLSEMRDARCNAHE